MHSFSVGAWTQRLKTSEGKPTLLVGKDLVFSLSCPLDRMQAVGLMLHELDRYSFRKEDLAGMGSMTSLIRPCILLTADPNLEMDMVRTAHIKPGKDGVKSY